MVACEHNFSGDGGVKEGQQDGGMHTVKLLEDALNSTRASTTTHSNVKFIGVRHVVDIEVKGFERFGRIGLVLAKCGLSQEI